MPRRQVRILILGSRKGINDRLSRQLVLAGYDAVVGDEDDLAVWFDRQLPDALVLDGVALTGERMEIVQGVIQNRGIPVIVLAGSRALHKVQKLCTPFDDVLTCPLEDARFLLQILSDLFGGSHHHAAVGAHPFPTRVTWPTARRLTASASR